MIEKVNPKHPDKIADRIAGALVDLAYTKAERPRIAAEVLIGHSVCHIIAETSEEFSESEIEQIVFRIAGPVDIDYMIVKQDPHLAQNQEEQIRCGDNGIFRGVPLTEEQKRISKLARMIYNKFSYDGKYILNGDEFIVCQSNAKDDEIREMLPDDLKARINPLGEWTGGPDVDSGATNRKLGSDMADSVTGGGLHGKDLSKADVAVNIYAFEKAQRTGKPVEMFCAIGDTMVDGIPYDEIVKQAAEYIKALGGFEKFAEWGLY